MRPGGKEFESAVPYDHPPEAAARIVRASTATEFVGPPDALTVARSRDRRLYADAGEVLGEPEIKRPVPERRGPSSRIAAACSDKRCAKATTRRSPRS
jgi:hypothetical protein